MANIRYSPVAIGEYSEAPNAPRKGPAMHEPSEKKNKGQGLRAKLCFRLAPLSKNEPQPFTNRLKKPTFGEIHRTRVFVRMCPPHIQNSPHTNIQHW